MDWWPGPRFQGIQKLRGTLDTSTYTRVTLLWLGSPQYPKPLRVAMSHGAHGQGAPHSQGIPIPRGLGTIPQTPLFQAPEIPRNPTVPRPRKSQD